MEDLFLQISLALLIVLGISFIMRILKQPLIIGYILAGIISGPLFLNLLSDNNSTIHLFSQLGIAFLLFIVGLHLSPKVIKEVGKISLITGIGQVIFTSLIGYFGAILLGFDVITSIYIAVALTFSSTIIIMKLLSDKEALDKLYGRISIGFLLVQDLIAILILLFVSSFSNGAEFGSTLAFTFLKVIGIFVVLIPVSIFILPRLSNFFARSQEVLFVFALSWGLGIAALFSYVGFSIEVGALVAGVMFSISPYSLDVSSKLKPLRDFFIISFFILLGSQMIFTEFSRYVIPAIIFSLFILIGNPLIVMTLMGLFGYSKNTGFMSGLTVAQISEFSLILVALGVRLGHVSQDILSFVTIIGLITIAGSTYLIKFSDNIYSKISDKLSIFERKRVKEKKILNKQYKYILLGENRLGFSIMQLFAKLKKEYLVVDFNPDRVAKLKKKKINAIYGDASNSDFLDEIKISKANLVVSTIPELNSNLVLIKKIKHKNKRTIVIVTSSQVADTIELYEAGADYVILPQFLGGEYTAQLIKKGKLNKRFYNLERKKQLSYFKERIG